MKPITLKLKYKGFIFGEFEYTEGNKEIETYRLNTLKLITYCASRLDTLRNIKYCRTGITVNEILTLNKIISNASAHVTFEILYRARLGRQNIASELEEKSDEFRAFIIETANEEIKAYKHRVIRGKVGSMKAGLPITQKPYQAGRVML